MALALRRSGWLARHVVGVVRQSLVIWMYRSGVARARPTLGSDARCGFEGFGLGLGLGIGEQFVDDRRADICWKCCGMTESSYKDVVCKHALTGVYRNDMDWAIGRDLGRSGCFYL